MNYTAEHLLQAETRQNLIAIALKNGIPIEKTLKKLRYEAELYQLQTKFVNLQKWIAKHQTRVAIFFEGRDAAGKGGSIKRFKEHLNPRSSRVVGLTKPTEVEKGQWYFRRYIQVLPQTQANSSQAPPPQAKTKNNLSHPSITSKTNKTTT